MSLADYASGPFPVLAKLAGLLRYTASAIFRFSAHLRRAKPAEKSPASDFDRAPPAIVEHSPNDKVVAAREAGASDSAALGRDRHEDVECKGSRRRRRAVEHPGQRGVAAARAGRDRAPLRQARISSARWADRLRRRRGRSAKAHKLAELASSARD